MVGKKARTIWEPECSYFRLEKPAMLPSKDLNLLPSKELGQFGYKGGNEMKLFAFYYLITYTKKLYKSVNDFIPL